MAKLGQEYKQGIIVQRSETGSAFQEELHATIEQTGSFESITGNGIKKVIVETTIKAGKPLEFEELPEASAIYAGKFGKVGSQYYYCTETSTNVFEWVEYVPA